MDEVAKTEMATKVIETEPAVRVAEDKLTAQSDTTLTQKEFPNEPTIIMPAEVEDTAKIAPQSIDTQSKKRSLEMISQEPEAEKQSSQP